jgi:hypothetical protein
MPSPLHTLLPLLAALTPLTTAACTRPFLTNITAAYVSAQTSGDPTALSALAPPSANFIYLENNRLTTLTTSTTLTTPLTISFTRSIHDPDQCATFTELIAATGPNPHVIHTRIVLDPASGQAALMESVVTNAGDWLFNATGTLALNAGEEWGVVAEGSAWGGRGCRRWGMRTLTGLGT